MRFASLGSGSEGNALVIEAIEGLSTTRVLLDCGFSLRETQKRLQRLALTLDDIEAIIITHEHADHIGSALTFARQQKIPLYTSWGTANAVRAFSSEINLCICESNQRFSFKDLQILPYTVPHDAREPLQYTFSNGKVRLGVLTDAGSSTKLMTEMLTGCNALVLECNHDRSMLTNSRYPEKLKKRIGGAQGHLANDTAAEILASIETERLQHIIAAHLSHENNRPELVKKTLADVLNTVEDDIGVACQAEGLNWRSIS